jgi:hypothetical protein
MMHAQIGARPAYAAVPTHSEQDLAMPHDLAESFARAITFAASAYLFARIGIGLLLT